MFPVTDGATGLVSVEVRRYVSGGWCVYWWAGPREFFFVDSIVFHSAL